MEQKERKKFLGEFQCDKCKRIFYRKWLNSKKTYSQLNEVAYWTEGKNWHDFKILCRACLNDWFEKTKVDFTNLVSEKKQRIFFHYRYTGLLDEAKEVYKN